jgi:hypothetical protein
LSIAIEELREGKLEVGFREKPEADDFLSPSEEGDQGAA